MMTGDRKGGWATGDRRPTMEGRRQTTEDGGMDTETVDDVLSVWLFPSSCICFIVSDMSSSAGLVLRASCLSLIGQKLMGFSEDEYAQFSSGACRRAPEQQQDKKNEVSLFVVKPNTLSCV